MAAPPDHQPVRDRIREAVDHLRAGGYIDNPAARRGVTSDLTIDESLILHSIGWEPVELVCGVGAFSVPVGSWQWATGEIAVASAAHARALEEAADQVRSECFRAGGHGVVGVHVDIAIERHYVNAVLIGTAVAPIGARRAPQRPFTSDLSARAFALLHQAGWDPLGLVFGASFVYAPRRGALDTIRQTSQNVELVNYTDALYSARESAMERMQAAATGLGAGGVVEVSVSEGPMPFASHAVRFTAWGTAVRRSERESSLGPPQVVVTLDDPSLLFAAESLRGG